MSKTKFKGVHTERDRHGKIRRYFRKDRQSRRIRLREEPGTQAFLDEIARAQLGLTKPAPLAKDKPKKTIRKVKGTFGWLAEEYLSRVGPTFAKSTVDQKRRVLTAIGDETCLSASRSALRDMDYRGLTKAHVTKLRDQKAGTPEAANHRVKALSALFEWACGEAELAETNPVHGVKKFKSNTTGHHTWTQDEMDQFAAHHSPGSKAHLCFTVLRYTGLRISDVSRLGPKHLYTDRETGLLHFKIATKKNENNTSKVIDMPVLPPLALAIKDLDEQATFVQTQWGKQYSIKSLGNRFSTWCNQANLPHCSAHGIRKADAVLAAEQGATAHELLSMFGWEKLSTAEIYTRKANAKRLSQTGSSKLLKK
ncbi:site-specific integrase [Pseudovibrio ascidiaceicola]|uniref:site-specific integrase n=1 Tax=Pseudovibrio ascidiaceicola TaxID=285279 RepID=UPI003D369FFE